MKPTTITICTSHQERQTPLIQTLAFNGAEYFCPYCGALGGLLGTGEDVPSTSELVGRQASDAAEAKDFIRSHAVINASSFLHEGKRITYTELPEAEKDRLFKIRSRWVAPIHNRAA